MLSDGRGLIVEIRPKSRQPQECELLLDKYSDMP